MSKEGRKLVAVKLTRAQWDLVSEAVYEWGILCRGEAEGPNENVLYKGKDQRGKRLLTYCDKIISQVSRQK